MKQIMTKLLNIQKEINPIVKDSTNPFFKSKYFDINKLLETIKPILHSHEVVLLQPLTAIDQFFAIKTILYDTISGESIEEVTPMPNNPDPQKMGSTITYFRRYSLQSLLGLQSDDDDASLGSDNDLRTKQQLLEKLRKTKLKTIMSNAEKVEAGDLKEVVRQLYKLCKVVKTENEIAHLVTHSQAIALLFTKKIILKQSFTDYADTLGDVTIDKEQLNNIYTELIDK